jgi:hypothetical protein
MSIILYQSVPNYYYFVPGYYYMISGQFAPIGDGAPSESRGGVITV